METIKKKRNWFRRHWIISGLLSIICLLVVLGLIVENLPSTKADKKRIQNDLWSWCQLLNDPNLGRAGYALDDSYLLTILSKGGAKWGFDRYNFETMPTYVTLIGWVPNHLWNGLYHDDKRKLLTGLELRLCEITRQKQSSIEELSALPFSIEIRDINSNRLLAKRSQSFLTDRSSSMINKHHGESVDFSKYCGH